MNELLAQDGLCRAVGERVRVARATRRLSRRALAHAADVSERYLVQLEAGAANVSIGVLARIARALDSRLVDFLPPGDSARAAAPEGEAPSEPLGEIIARMTAREQAGAVPVLQKYLVARRRSLKGVALIGLRGAGKSTIGALFAARHALPFVSVTREIETRAGMSLADLFNLGGPDAYRTLENDVVADLARRDERMVLETAGGIVNNRDALEIILAAYKTVWLKASPEEHLDRVVKQGDMRPMQGTLKALEHLKALLTQREPEYRRAEWVLDTSRRTPEECVNLLDQAVGSMAHAAAV